MTGLLVGGVWISAVAHVGGAQIFFIVVLVSVLSMAAHAWRQTDAGHLTWGGASWVWSTGQYSRSGCVVVHFDIQSHMVVTLQDGQGRSIWLWLDRACDPVCWRALRRALYADIEAVATVGGQKDRVNAEGSL
jgi:hypothetical protein